MGCEGIIHTQGNTLMLCNTTILVDMGPAEPQVLTLGYTKLGTLYCDLGFAENVYGTDYATRACLVRHFGKGAVRFFPVYSVGIAVKLASDESLPQSVRACAASLALDAEESEADTVAPDAKPAPVQGATGPGGSGARLVPVKPTRPPGGAYARSVLAKRSANPLAALMEG
jgi:hypothetical protein